jgi:hypothetical protein
VSTLVAIDPGLRVLGMAEFEDGALTGAHLVRNPNQTDRGAQAWLAIAIETLRAAGAAEPDLLVHELMQVYDTKGQKGDQADLIELAGVAGTVAGVLFAERALSYVPREWKGNLPKKVHHKRGVAALYTAELETLMECPDAPADLVTFLETASAEALFRNVLDAVCLGLFQLGRLKGTVKPR